LACYSVTEDGMHDSEGVGPMDFAADRGLLRVDTAQRGVPGVAVFGEIDIATVGVLRDALSRVRASSGTLTIDLSGVTFIGSCGLTVLMQAQREAERDGRQLALAQVAPCVERALQISGYETIFRRV
jgi:anti-sigma B factor antagonist